MLGYSQKNSELEKNEIIETRIEYLSGEDEDLDYTTIFDNLYYYFDHPINLNQVNQLDKLLDLSLVNTIQLNDLKRHIEEEGKLISIFELQAIPTFDMQTIRNIEPFVKVSRDFDDPSITIKEIFKYSKSEVYVRNIRELQKQEGFSPIDDAELEENPNKRYLGSPDKLFFRYRFKYQNKISVSFLGEKDQGEEFFKGSQKQGFDFYSGHFFIKGFGKFKALAIGDYHAQFGQGLTIWTGQAFGKSADGINGIKRNAYGLKPYAAVDENNFLRGAATTLSLGKFEVTGFVSRKKIDANIVQDTIEEGQDIAFSSFQASGFHRTPGELDDKDAVGEFITGGRAAYVGKRLTIGTQGIYSRYDGVFDRNLQIYNQFDFSNSQNSVFGADYDYVYKNFNFFGEVSRSQNGGVAYINGVLIALDPRLSFTITHRSYDKDFQNLSANALAEGSRPINEKGIYMGMSSVLGNGFTLTGYYDKFRFPWLRFQTDNISTNGYEALAQLHYKPKRGTTMYFRIRSQNKPINDFASDEIERIRPTVDQLQVNYRFNITYKVSDNWSLRNRAEVINYTRGDADREDGYLIYQDVIYKPMGKPYSFSGRYALFQTDSYNSRIYAYENDVLYYFYIPAYYRTGSRFYLTARYKYRKTFDFWIRYGVWQYRNEESILSGLSEIQGNIRSDLKLVFRYLF